MLIRGYNEQISESNQIFLWNYCSIKKIASFLVFFVFLPLIKNNQIKYFGQIKVILKLVFFINWQKNNTNF
jgi:hypothetical protein